MRLEELVLHNFRNYEQAEIRFSPVVNVFLGRNAQGKTNLVEAIYLLSLGKSFRTREEAEIIRHGAPSCSASGRFVRPDGAELLVEYRLDAKGKTIKENNVPLRKAQDLFGRIMVVLFSPDDLQLIKGSPGNRRNYLDLNLAQTRPGYRMALLEYNRLLRQRNEILRRVRDGFARREELVVWNESLVQRAAEIVKERSGALGRLARLIGDYHHRLTDKAEEISLAYKLGSHSEMEEDLEGYYRRQIELREREEIRRALTLIGPHRDDIEIGFSTGYDLRSYGSQGQQRTAALSMKLASVDFMRVESGEEPILLLDDVLSEFDGERKKALLTLLLASSQTVITATDQRYFDMFLSGYSSFMVKEGRVGEVSF